MVTLTRTLQIPPEAQQVAAAIRDGKRFLMVPHINIDGDDLGCMIGLALALRELDKEVYLYSPDQVPQRFHYMPGHELVSQTLPEGHFDAIFVLECPEIGRLPQGIDPHKMADIVITLDHHIDSPGRTRFVGDINWVDAGMSALGEMIAEVLIELNIPISRAAAIALYTSIITDSNAFRYHGVTPRTHLLAAHLLESLDPSDTDTIHFNALASRTAAEKALAALCTKTLKFRAEGRIAYCDLTSAMLEEAGIAEEDTQMLLPDLNNLQGVEIFALFKTTTPGCVRVSLRAHNVPVVKVAGKHGGGGHSLAAAMKVSDADLESLRAQILDELEALLQEERG